MFLFLSEVRLRRENVSRESPGEVREKDLERGIGLLSTKGLHSKKKTSFEKNA